ncbi:GH36-type glycosyl hydrolase domain-containing protein [Rhodomicrobium lacus]|uniref:GH36-type glycosyl hydrolase domain-containing protein n=1 Tax=Rhodomicrobium lacus TaxID=2498452 RepID=UPI0026E2A5E7|nr:cellobiose phosphorylase [Rhodomicrobium lacus]WKW50057.1 cellobiose phosphorylase [Rhodomicrobium lacus]
MTATRSFRTPREEGLGLARIANAAGLRIAVLPNGCLFAIEHEDGPRRILVNQVLGSPVGGGIMRILLRTGGAAPRAVEIVGPGAHVAFGAYEDRFVWAGETDGLAHRVTLWLHPEQPLWLWRVEVTNAGGGQVPCDAILVQDLGLGARGFVMGNEAYASQYIDHTVERHPRFGPVIMSRQNMTQDGGRHPWVAHGCFDGAASFATDALQLFGPAYRDAAALDLPFGESLPGERLQYETACAIVQSSAAELQPGQTATWTFFAVYDADHAAPTSYADLSRIDSAEGAASEFFPREVTIAVPVRDILRDARPLACREDAGRDDETRKHAEWWSGRLLSWFEGDCAESRHVVLTEKDRLVKRRHGTILRSGASLLPEETTLAATAWMHGAFAAQLTIGNTSFHKLFSVSRDPYNITRWSGVRVLAEIGGEWRLLTLPSRFEMGLADARWIYKHDGGAIAVRAVSTGEDAALQIEVLVEGAPVRLLVFGNLTLGEFDYAHAGRVEIDEAEKRAAFRPDPESLWGQQYPDAVYHLTTSTPEAVEAIGGDELLYKDGAARGGPFIALRTRPTNALRLAVTGSMTDAADAERLAAKYAGGIDTRAMLASAADFWASVTRGARLQSGDTDIAAFDTLLPWLVHNAIIHLTAPHGLEQYSGAAWGTRDVCQGPMEFLLAFHHDETAKEVLRRVIARQSKADSDWPQWFMFDRYAWIAGVPSHGDVIVWPLKAVCDYIEATQDFAFLSEPVGWREAEAAPSSVSDHLAAELAEIEARFLPGTHLPRYGEGDWNDTLQPADASLAERMASSWTAALLFQQVSRYAVLSARAGNGDDAAQLAALAGAIRADFNRWLIRDGVVAGYAIFDSADAEPELLLHPSDKKTGVSYSLIPMNCAISGGLFTAEQARTHLGLIREHLNFPDGVRLMDRPLPYYGGEERIFRRAESSPFFGREVGQMYVHAHLRWCEAMALMGDDEAFWWGLRVVNPVTVAGAVGNAALRQRNCYASSSDAAFSDRYEASAEWERVRAGDTAAEAGWRIYSGGPGLYLDLLIRHLAGLRRSYGDEVAAPFAPIPGETVVLTLNSDTRAGRKGSRESGKSMV